MKKAEAEAIILAELGVWVDQQLNSGHQKSDMSWSDFRTYLLELHPRALSFKSTAGPDFDAELWFDQFTNQTWKR